MQAGKKYSFPSAFRLRKAREFGLVQKMGCRIHTPHFILLKMPSRSGVTKLGLTVSRKVGNAVCRNRIKRLLREYFRQHRHNFDPPIELSVIAKRNAGEIEAKTVAGELDILKKKG
ncbi:MAG TPA: ribonuclease P protein component [Geopsychrobacteraceae bacterium]